MKGIMFKPDMIQAIVEGRKAQTRRVIKYTEQLDYMGMTSAEAKSQLALSCYQVGETVYIKEAHYRYGWWVKNGIAETGRQKWRFKFAPSLESDHIGGEDFRYPENPPSDIKPNSYHGEGWYKRSPLFMPEWAARHFIKITGVGAERLQEITTSGVIAEGHPTGANIPRDSEPAFIKSMMELKTGWFIAVWNSINPKHPWESNPWVFVYEFELLRNN